MIWYSVGYSIPSIKIIKDIMLFCDKASEMWKELEERYGQSDRARLFQAQKVVSCISQGNLDIASYFKSYESLG